MTRLHVDDIERPFFRYISSNEKHYHINGNVGKIWLEKGKHTAKI